MIEELRAIIGSDEKILYEGKPDKRCYIFESIFNPLLPFALIWVVFDMALLGGVPLSQTNNVILIFILFHMMPVWIYLSGILFTSVRYRNTTYIITDRAIYLSGGVFTKNIKVKPFAELSHINLHRGIFDQIFNVGDIIATTDQLTQNQIEHGYLTQNASICISSIQNYIEVYNMVKKLQNDIYTDVMYPNAKRNSENPGYNTEYKGL